MKEDLYVKLKNNEETKQNYKYDIIGIKLTSGIEIMAHKIRS